MPDITGPPQVSFAGGFFSGRVDSDQRESAQLTWYQLQSVDFGPAGTGAAIGSSQTSQTTGYQISAAITGFTTVTPGVTGNGNTPTAAAVLPQTSRPEPFAGLLVYVGNTGANPINLYPHPSDPSNSINGQAANTPIILGVNTITALQCYTAGTWQADGVGEGFAGSIATGVSQGNVTAAGGTQASATPIVQALANITSGTNGVLLPPAKAGLSITLANNAGAPVQVYATGTDTINGTAGATGVAQSNLATGTPPQVAIYYCFTNGVWLTK